MYMQGEENMNYQCIYPDVYYKVQPFVMMACDEMDAHNYGMPDCDMVKQISDHICEDVCRVHPDLLHWEYDEDMPYDAISTYSVPGSLVESQRFHRRRGGFFQDLVTIILLNEFFRRRRHW